MRTALTSDSDRAAIVISYSGLAPNLKEILPILSSRHVPVIVIGTPYCARIHPGFAAYLTVSDHESMTTASRGSQTISPCNTYSIRSIAATLPKITPAAPSS